MTKELYVSGRVSTRRRARKHKTCGTDFGHQQSPEQAMAIDFTFSPNQRELQRHARSVAREVLSQVPGAIRHLATPSERFLATRPMYEQVIREGFLRRLIPMPFGGEGTGLLDMAIVAEEFHAVDCNV